MANASTRTLLSLDRFADIIGFHPLLFNQITGADLTPTGVCGMPLLKYSWQKADAVGREEIARYLELAEGNLAENLGFKVAPTWEVAERHPYPRPRDPLSGNLTWDVRGGWLTIRTKWGHVLHGGIEAFELLQAAASVVYTDADSDSYKETATVTVLNVSADLDVNEVVVYYPVTSAPSARDPAWEIRPIRASLSGTTLTITFKREQTVLISKQEPMMPVGVDAFTDANFLTTVDVYRRYNDRSVQVSLEWESPCTTSGLGTFTTQTGVLIPVDPKLGIVRVQPATWNTSTLQWDYAYLAGCQPPSQVRLWYQAGWRWGSTYYTVDPLWERAETFYALSLLDRPLCACNTLEAQMGMWRDDLALRRADKGANTSYNLATRTFENPLGTKRGSLYAWERVRRYRLPETGDD